MTSEQIDALCQAALKRLNDYIARCAAREARQAELDAIRQCTATHGPGVAVAWTVDGDIVCRARRGSGPVTVASSKGGAL